MSHRRPPWISVSIALLVLAGCTPNIPKPVPIAGNLIAAAAVNPDITGRASPVAVKIYQLKSAGSFESGDFFALYAQPAATLGADLVSLTEITVRPGETKRFDQEIELQTRFVGVVAGFRNLENAQWRAVVPVPPKKLESQQLDVTVKDLAAKVEFTKAR